MVVLVSSVDPAPDPDLDGATEQDHGVRVVPLPGPFFGGRLAEHFTVCLPLRGDAAIALDASAVQYLDAVGLRVLVGMARDLHAAGVDVSVCGTSRPVRLLLAAAGVQRYAELQESRPLSAAG